MTHRKTLRLITTGALAALAVAAPVAEAAQPAVSDDTVVCNQATPHSLGGTYVATDGDPTPPARYQEGLKAHPGQGAGLVNAASHSPALSLCGDGGDTPPDFPDLPDNY